MATFNPVKHPGALHRALGIKIGEKIPPELIDKKIAELRAKSKKQGGLNMGDSKLLKRLDFAKNAANWKKR